MNRLLASATALLIAATVSAAPQHAERLRIEEHGNSGLTLHYSSPTANGRLSDVDPKLESVVELSDGRTAPVVSRLVVVPEGHKMEVTVSDRQSFLMESEAVYRRDSQNIQATPVALSTNDDCTWEQDGEVQRIELDPPLTAKVGRVEVWRGIPVAPVTLYPMQREVDGERLIENRELSVDVRFVPDPGAPTVPRVSRKGGAAVREFRKQFLNFPHRDHDEPQSSHLGRILILHDGEVDFEGERNYLDTLVTWKRQLGYMVDVEPIDIDDATPLEIRRMVRTEYYLDQEFPIDYLILVGSEDQAGAIYFPSYQEGELVGDHPYSLMENDDSFISDVALGRIECRTVTEFNAVVNRSIRYERTPEMRNQDWFTKAVYSAENITVPGGQFVPSMLHLGYWTMIKCRQFGYTQVDTFFQKDTTVSSEDIDGWVRNSLRDGRSLAISRGWLRGCYDLGNMDPADVRGMFPFVISITCLSHETQSAFYRSGTLGRPNGPIASLSVNGFSHSNVNNSIVGGTVRGMFNFNASEAGWIVVHGKRQLWSDNRYDIGQWEREILMALRLMGDPSVRIYNARPYQLEGSHPEQIIPNSRGLNIDVTDGETAVGDAWVCVTQPGGVHLVAQPGDDGVARFTFDEGDLEEGELTVTISRHNAIPYIGSIAVETTEDMVELAGVEFDDRDGLFGPGEDIPAAFTFVNSGENDLEDLTVTFSTEDHLMTFSDQTLDVDNLEAGAETVLETELSFDVSGKAGRPIHIDIQVSAGNGSEWTHAVDLVSSGTNLMVGEDVEFPDDPFRPGNRVRIIPGLQNDGDLPSPQLGAILVCDDPYVEVVNGEATYPAVPAGELRNPQGNLVVNVDTLAIKGNRVEFRLLLSTEGEGLRDTVLFEQVLGEAGPTDPFGPDEYGYICYDNFDEGWEKSPEFNWIEINPALDDNEFEGTLILEEDFAVDEDRSIAMEMPFQFQYYGETFDTLVINSNGWVAFGAQWALLPDFRSQQIPGIQGPDAQIAVFWQDLIRSQLNDLNGVYYYYVQELGMFVVEWSNLQIYHSPQDEPQDYLIEFQLQLLDPRIWPTSTGDGEIRMQYKTVLTLPGNDTDNLYYTVGLKNLDNTGGLEYAYWDHYAPGGRRLQDGMALTFTTDRLNARGALEGRVVRREDNEAALEGVTVTAVRSGEQTVTDADGRYQFDEVLAGFDFVRFEKNGFNVLTVPEVEIAQNETATLNVELTHPVVDIGEDYRFQQRLQPGEYGAHRFLEIGNTGNGPLDYRLTRRYSDSTATGFEITWNMNISAALEFDGQPDRFMNGCQFVGDELYVPSGRDRRDFDDNVVYVFSRDGDIADTIRSFPQPSLSVLGFSDLAWDGEETLYGGTYVPREAEVDTALRNHVVIVAFSLQGEPRDIFKLDIPINELQDASALAWHSEHRTLLVSDDDASNVIYEVNLEGEVVSEIGLRLLGEDLTIRGLAWNQISDEGMPLLMLDAAGETGMRLWKVDPNNGALRIVHTWENEEDYNVVGLTVGYDWESGEPTASLGLIGGGRLSRNDDHLVVIETGPDSRFLRFIDPIEGSVDANSTGSVHVLFQADGLERGMHTFNLFMEHNAASDPVLIPVDLEVTDEAGVGDGWGELPYAFSLGEAYPNPFNSTTRIDFSLAESVPAKLAVYDLAGREIAVLVDELVAAGRHRAVFESREMSSGIYFYRLQAGAHHSVKRMVLIR